MGFNDISVVSLLAAPEGLKAIDNRFGNTERKKALIYILAVSTRN